MSRASAACTRAVRRGKATRGTGDFVALYSGKWFDVFFGFLTGNLLKLLPRSYAALFAGWQTKHDKLQGNL